MAPCRLRDEFDIPSFSTSPSCSLIFRAWLSIYRGSSIRDSPECALLLHYKNKYPTRLEETTKRYEAWRFARRIKIKYISMKDISHARYRTRYFPVHATEWRRESRWRVRLVAVMPAADVSPFLLFFFVFYILERSVSWSGIYRLALRPLSCITLLRY